MVAGSVVSGSMVSGLLSQSREAALCFDDALYIKVCLGLISYLIAGTTVW
jgi:hypothetical protein